MSIAHFTPAKRDVIATRDFFAETLGWEPITRPDNVEVDAAWLRIAPGQELHLLRVPDFEPSDFEREFGRHFAVGVSGRWLSGVKGSPDRAGSRID